MDALQIREIICAAAGLLGLLSVYCGYKLFCEIPQVKDRATNLVHGLSGALLALFGMTLLIIGIHSLSAPVAPQSRAAVRRTGPAEAGSFTPHVNKQRSKADWSI